MEEFLRVRGSVTYHRSDAPIGPFFEGVGVFWGEEASLLLRGGYAVGLYERLLLEAAELPEDPNRERNERMWTYLKNMRRPVPEGGATLPRRSWN